ncbi:MAG: TonB-dependent receptor [Opitutaceae bacterium]|nr:TonB-dependent receptor [Opitutaceae bacterium]
MFPALLGALTHAAGIDEPTALPPWVVAESRLPPDAAPVRASSVLTSQAWSGRSIGTLADAFRQIPGAIMQESFGGIEPPRLSIRGSGVQSAPTSRGLALLLDELPLGLADGSFNTTLLEPMLGGSVQVQRGLDGWRTAPATMGGALDVRTDVTGREREVVNLEAGSFGAFRARASAARDHGRTAAAAAVAFSRQAGYRAQSDQARTAAHMSLRRALRPEVTVSAGVYHAHARYAVPGPLTLVAASIAPRSVSSDVQRDQPRRVAEITRLTARAEQRSATRELLAAASVARTADDFLQLQPNGVSRSRSDDASLHLAFAERFVAIGIPHQLRVAATATRGWRELQRFTNETGRLGTQFARDGLCPTTVAVQIEEVAAITRTVVATLGVARVSARRDVVDRIAPGPARRLSSSETLPQASLRWSVARETALFATVSGSAEPPTFDDLIVVTSVHPVLQRRMQSLATQHAITTEIGARGRAGDLSWDFAAYRARWQNEILRLSDSAGVPRGVVNASPTTHAGIESAARWVIVERGMRVSLAATATWTNIRFEADAVHGRGRLAGLPPHVGAAEVLIESPRGVFAAAGADWTAGHTRVDHAGRLGYGGRTLAHGRGGWRFARGFACFLDVRNVFDRASIASTAGVLDLARSPAATSIFLPAPGRSFTFGIEWKR